MFDLATIRRMNREAGKKANHDRLGPMVAQKDQDELVMMMPNLGDYTPKGWKCIERFFVDSSGFGQPGEPALTAGEFLAKVKKGHGYGLVSCGQFQVHVGEFVRTKGE